MKQFTEHQRYELKAYLKSGKSKNEIASLLGFHRSTIYREIRRNKFNLCDPYDACYAQYRYERRKECRSRKIKFTPSVERLARLLLSERHLSPEQIVGRCKRENIPMVSHERLYQWIWQDKGQAGKLHTFLRRAGKKYQSRKKDNQNRGNIKNRVDISQRPKIVEKKNRFGDLEIDTIIGKNHSGAILTINDRATGRLWTEILRSKESKYVTAATINILLPYKGLIHTITSDNGSEFAGHEEIARELGIKFYFAKPYHSWQRGANENLNGLIRQYLPKWKEFKYVYGEQLQQITHLINARPRKRYGFLNPMEMMSKIIANKYYMNINKKDYQLSHL